MSQIARDEAFSRRPSGILVARHGQAGAVEYSDGVETEQRLRKVLENAKDLTHLSPELEDAVCDWPTEYHLSAKRANLLRALDLSGFSSVLELGCGCGAITRYLGDMGMRVDAVEGSMARAELAALRCRDLGNVNIICSNFNDLDLSHAKYDAVLFIGVLEYAGRFHGEAASDRAAVMTILENAMSVLTDRGVVIIAIENRVGLKYMLGACEDHYGRPYMGIHDYPERAGIRTYTRQEWVEMTDQLGVTQRMFLLPFPDYKVPTVVLSEDYVNSNPNAFCHLEGVMSRDYHRPLFIGDRESIMWEACNAAQTLPSLANSFLVLLGGKQCKLETIAANDFAHLPQFNRLLPYCVTTRKPAGSSSVIRESLTSEHAEQGSIRQKVADEPYTAGRLLSVEWARCAQIYEDETRLAELYRKYYEFLREREKSGKLNIDNLPSNVIVTPAGDYTVFDEEWTVDHPIDARYVFFRALLIFASRHQNTLVKLAAKLHIYNVREFIVHAFAAAGHDAATVDAALPGWIETEEGFQRNVMRARSLNQTFVLLQQPIGGAPTEESELQVYWKYDDRGYVEERSVSIVTSDKEGRQTVRLTLPADASKMTFFRLDPADGRLRPDLGFLKLYRVEVFLQSADGSKESVWAQRGEPDIVQNGHLQNMTYHSNSLGSVFMIVNDDPSIEFSFIARRLPRGDEFYVVEVDLEFRRDVAYVLARDRFLVRGEVMERRLRQLESVHEEKKELDARLKEIERSRAWRLVTKYRNFLQGVLHPFAASSRRLRDVTRYKGPAAAGRALVGSVERRVRMALGKPVTPTELPTTYEQWLDKYWAGERAGRRHALEQAANGPLVSVLMPVYNTDPALLAPAVDSVLAQSYEKWELCIVDDGSTRSATRSYLSGLNHPKIRVERLQENRNIGLASRAAADVARGEYLALLDHDDELHHDALLWAVSRIRETGADLVYTDEDFIRTDGHLDLPHFKPDYSPDLLLSHNYITHLVVLKRSLYDDAGGFRGGFDGAQDYDLLLRCTECAAKISHLARPLYHWRMSKDSTSLSPGVKPGAHDNARRALQEALDRRAINAEARDTGRPYFFRVKRAIHGEPMTSIIIPFKDKPGLLRTCIDAILEKSTYRHYEVLGVSNDTLSISTHDLMKEYGDRDERVRFIEYNIPFNFSSLVNHGVANARGEHIILLNNDVEIITGEWMENLLEHSQRDEVAAVGGKLYYPDNTIQHAGIAIGLGGYAGHLHKNFPAYAPGYFNRLNVTQNVTAVTGAMLATRRELFQELGGFDEIHFAIAYNDVDFCMRARQKGYLNVYTPYVEAYHHESLSRGYEVSAAQQERFRTEMANLRSLHGAELDAGDPYYNVNFDQGRDDFSLRRID